MAFFFNGITRDKLVILYFLHITNYELLQGTLLSEIMRVYKTGEYFSLAEALGELAETKHVAIVTHPTGNCFCISAYGRQIVDEFSERLPQSLRSAIDVYAAENRRELMEQSQHFSGVTKLDEKQYLVECKIVENDMTLLKLNLNVSSAVLAGALANSFEHRAPELYKAVIDTLLTGEEEAGQTEQN